MTIVTFLKMEVIMIVDVHYHYLPTLGPPEMKNMLTSMVSGLYLTISKKMGRPINLETFTRELDEKVPDPNGEKVIQNMEENGIDFCVLLNVDMPDMPEEMIQEFNKNIGRLAQDNPNKMMAFAGIDPRRSNSTDLLKQCFEEFGCKGLKYHPDIGYDPSSPESLKLLEVLHDNNGILLTHTSPLPGSMAKFAEADLLSDVVFNFPDLPIIAAHMGYINWRPWASLANYSPNLYGDLAIWDEKAIGNYNYFCRELRDIIDAVGVEKIMFGTDDPFNLILRSTKEYIQLIKDLPEKSPEGIQFSNNEVDAILGGNAVKLLNLN